MSLLPQTILSSNECHNQTKNTHISTLVSWLGRVLVPEGIIHPVVSVWTLTLFIRCIHYRNLKFLHNAIINKKVLLRHWLSCWNHFISCLQKFKMIWLSNLLALSVPDEGYYRNALWALNLISTILFTLSHFKGIAGFHVLLCWKFAFYDINFAFQLVLLKFAFWCRVNFLFQPFWPQGTGCARGFLGVMDTAWMIKNWKEMQGRPFDIIAERESVYKVLSQTNPNNLKKKYSEYTIDPKSR